MLLPRQPVGWWVQKVVEQRVNSSEFNLEIGSVPSGIYLISVNGKSIKNS